MSFQIITDTGCDFPAAMYDQLGLNVVPLNVLYQGQNYETYTVEWLKEMYAGLKAGEKASTSAINPDRWASAMEPVLQSGKDVLVLVFSSGLSTTYQSAVIAAGDLQEQYPDRKINVVDTLCASMGQGLFVWYACQKQQAGLSLDEVTAWCEENKLHLCHWVVADDLMHLKRGGRISAATAVAGTLLNIKPIIHVNDEGKLISVGKARGRKAAIQTLCNKIGELGLPGENETIFISHADCLEDAEALAEMAKAKYGIKEVVISYIGAVIGAHTGPGTMAIFFLGKNR